MLFDNVGAKAPIPTKTRHRATAIELEAERAYTRAMWARTDTLKHVKRNRARNAVVRSVLAGVNIQPVIARQWEHGHYAARHSEQAPRYVNEARI